MERGELLEALLDCLPDGVVVISQEGVAVCWNRAVEAITGYAALEVVGKPLPEQLEVLANTAMDDEAWPGAGHRRRLELRHKMGHVIKAIAMRRVLRDGLGGRIGWVMLIHPAQSLDALPHGESDGNTTVLSSQEELEVRLQQKFGDFREGGEPFGILWISVDQAHILRKTHGAGACEAMLAKVQDAMAQGLRAADEMGRWGTDEFLVIAHERTAEMLAAHAQTLAGLARTADFRWWGDRVQLTVSIGFRQAEPDEEGTLDELLKSARKAMEASIHAGGNTITEASGR
ncbi:MAG: diguanylate cyclase [Terracidiphilus sp.]|nr:diguanylate cyclase [Terracidiphilus sp.]